MGIFERQIGAGLAKQPLTCSVRSVVALAIALVFATNAPTKARGDSFENGHVQTRTCELTADPDTDEGAEAIDFVLCARGNAGAEVTAVTGVPHENFWTRFARGALGAYYGEYLSVQARAHRRDIVPFQSGQKDVDSETDRALVQVGNPALHRFSLQAGRMPLPFGIDSTWAPESYRRYENRAFWASPRYAAALGFDNKVNTRLDIGYAEDPRHVVPNGFDDTETRHTGRLSAASVRLSYDLAALDGSRIMASGYGENHGVRKMGLGLINISRRADTTELEFVRRLAEPTGGKKPFQQLLRLAYAGAYRGSTRWIVQFDDERFRYRMGTVGQEMKVHEYGLARLSIAYQKSETGDNKRRWMFTTGVGAQL